MSRVRVNECGERTRFISLTELKKFFSFSGLLNAVHFSCRNVNDRYKLVIPLIYDIN